MVTVAIILSIISIIASIFKNIGIIVSLVSLIVALILLKVYWKIDYQKRTVVITIIITTIALINSFIFTLFSDTIGVLLSNDGSQALSSTKNTRLLQDYNSLKNSVSYYKSSKQSVNKLIGAKETKILNTAKDIQNYPEQVRQMMATSDSKKTYYKINFNNLEYGVLISNKNCWLIDKQGNIYLNIIDYSGY